MDTRQPLTQEESDALNKDLQAVLEKHNCDMGVEAIIKIWKTVEPKEIEEIVSPYKDGENPETAKTN